MPPASFTTLVQSLLTQTLLYLGEYSTQGGPRLNLDTAKHQIDTMAVLEEKTKGNLTEEEQHTLDSALYERGCASCRCRRSSCRTLRYRLAATRSGTPRSGARRVGPRTRSVLPRTAARRG